jgi:haloacid dehalogenase superfamily, subfamily IA, variant 1 with third motif having Dx(3-4)D or Dx(3-4)E
MLPQAIIFDLDDTIISTTGTANDTWKAICSEYCSLNSCIDCETLYATVIDKRLAFWADKKNNEFGRKNQKAARREIIRRVFDKLKLPANDIERVADSFSERRLMALKLFPNAIETLEFVRSKPIKTSLITNGEESMQRYKINKFNLGKYFDYIFVETEVGYGKPEERIFKLALDKMNVSPQDTWSIGDNLIWDVKAPQNVGIYGIWVDFESAGLPKGAEVKPDRIVTSIDQILEFPEIKSLR